MQKHYLPITKKIRKTPIYCAMRIIKIKCVTVLYIENEYSKIEKIELLKRQQQGVEG